jgi:hypothetical protein
MYRANVGVVSYNGSTCPEEYFRINVFLPFLDTIMIHLDDCFGNAQKKISQLAASIPAKVDDMALELIAPTIGTLSRHLGNDVGVLMEIELWIQRWKRAQKYSRSLL